MGTALRRPRAPGSFARFAASALAFGAAGGCRQVVRSYDAVADGPEAADGSEIVDGPGEPAAECGSTAASEDRPEPSPPADASTAVRWCDLLWTYSDAPFDGDARAPCDRRTWSCVRSPSEVQDCVGDRCAARCLQPGADCDRDPTTACDVDTWSDPRNCGACGRACAAGESCEAGRCLRVGARALAPISALRTLVRRPWFRWALPPGADGARLELCPTRTCERVEGAWDVTGTAFRPPAPLAPGVHFWRVTARRGPALDPTPSSPWEVWVGPAPEGAPSEGAMADVDGDGAEDVLGDLVPARPPPDRMLLGTRHTIQPLALPQPIGDVNGDGFGDVGVVQYTVNLAAPYSGLQQSHLLVFRGGPSGATRATLRFPLPNACLLFDFDGRERLIPVGDRDGDGYGDVLVYLPWGCNNDVAAVAIYGGATLTAGAREHFSHLVLWVGHGDFDADGFEDVATSCGSSAPCGLYLNVLPGGRDRSPLLDDRVVQCADDGSGHLLWYSPATVDQDDDGFDDLLTRSTYWESTPGYILGGAGGLDGARCHLTP